MYLLIDNCSLLNLVHSEGYGHFLLELESHISRGHIRLLTHEHILAEWQRHRSGNKARIMRKLHQKSGKSNTPDGTLLPSTINIEHIEIQYQQIDRLLDKAIKLPTPPTIEQEFAQRYKQRLAPFHEKLDSQNDWEIIGSAGHYAEMNALADLYFLSSNDTDFADPANRARAIHPDLQSRFPNVGFHYFRDVKDFISALSQLELPDDLHRFTLQRNEKFSFKASLRSNDIDSLYQLLKYTYDEVGFIPPHLLRRYYPFSKSEKDQAYFSLFGFFHVRKELAELLAGVSVEGETVKITKPDLFTGIENAQEKLEFVLLRLTDNLIFNVSSGDLRADIRYNGKGHCDCIRCCYHRFEWAKSINQLEIAQTDMYDRLKTAYYNYQLGQYHLAARQMADMREAAYAAGNFVLYFVCQYNLRHLAPLLQNPFFSHDFTPEEIEAFRNIDLFEEAVKLKSKTDFDLLTYIADADFFKGTLDTVAQQATQIEDQYYAYLQGGWSANSYVYKMIVEFAELESFVHKNFVIYDAYDNWQRLTGQVIKGLFASHAMRDSENSALLSFDDFLVNVIIFYGDRNTINKYFNRYQLKDLVYKQSSKDTGFLKSVLTLMQQERAMRTALAGNAALDGGRVNQEFNLVFQNMMIMAALLETAAFDINILAEALLRFLKTEASLNHHGIIAITDFITRKGRHFKHGTRKKFLTFLLKDLEKYEPNMLLALIRNWPARSITDFQHDRVLSYALKTSGPHYHPDRNYELLTYLGKCSNPHQKQKMAKAISARLSEEFNFELYYHVLIHGLLPFEKKRVFALLDEIDPDKKTYSIRSISTGREEVYLPRLDQLLNVCFKYGIPIKGKRFSRFRKRSPYYNWLLNMDHFDYRNFKMEWVTRYPTDFYYTAMGHSKKLKEQIVAHLRSNKDSAIEKALIKISFYNNL